VVATVGGILPLAERKASEAGDRIPAADCKLDGSGERIYNVYTNGHEGTNRKVGK
jgi:hypothetical protein